MNPEQLEEIRRLNVVLAEDDEQITAVPPCPDTEHGYGTTEHGYGLLNRVAGQYVGTFSCKHGMQETVFCTEHIAQRRAYQENGQVWACLAGKGKGNQILGEGTCLGSRLIRVYLFHPIPKAKHGQ